MNSQHTKNIYRHVIRILAVVFVGSVAVDFALIAHGLLLHQRAPLFQGLLGSASAAIGLLSLGIRAIIPRPGNQTDLREFAKKLNRSRLALINEEISAALFRHRSPPIDIGLVLLSDSSGKPAKQLLRFTAIRELFLSVPYGRVAVIGSPGAGKSLLALQFALQVSSASDDDYICIPIIIPAQTWDPEAPSLDYWLIRQAVNLLDIDKSLAWSLIREDIIIPVIDGLDEMDGAPCEASNAAQLIKSLNDCNRKFLITCRTDSWESLEEAGCTLEDSCRVRLEPLTSRQVTEYLEARNRPDEQRAIPLHVIRELSRTLGSTLSTPFDLALMGSLMGRHESIRKLRQRIKRGMSPGEIETELLEAFVEARVRWYPKRVEADPRRSLRYRSGSSRYYSVVDVLKWSHSLASFLEDTGGRDIFKRRMSTTAIYIEHLWPVGGRYVPRIVDHILTIMFWAPLLAFLTVTMISRGYSPKVIGFIVASTAVLPASSMWVNRAWVHPTKIVLRRLSQPRRLFRLVLGISIAIVIIEIGSPDILVAFAAYYGIGFALVFALGAATSVRDSISLPALAGTGLLIGLAGMELTRIGVVPTGDPILSLASGVVAGAVSLLVGVKVAILVAGRRGGGGLDLIPAGLPTPLARLHDDFNTGLVAALSTMVLVTLIAFISRWPDSPSWETVVFCGLAGVAAGPGYAAATWRRHLAMLICARNKLPFRLTKFLKWAHSVGLLRAAGRAYEFRHRRVQDWLAQ